MTCLDVPLLRAIVDLVGITDEHALSHPVLFLHILPHCLLVESDLCFSRKADSNFDAGHVIVIANVYAFCNLQRVCCITIMYQI